MHEPENDRDFDRDDDDEERITEDDEEDDDDEDDEKNVAENIKKSGVKDEISSPSNNANTFPLQTLESLIKKF